MLDLRIGKLFRLGRLRATANVDLYNVFNANDVTAENHQYGTNGASWLTPSPSWRAAVQAERAGRFLGQVRGVMKRFVETAILAAVLIAPPPAAPTLSAQQGAPAEPLRIIPTDSLFDRYTVESKWGQLPPGQPWGGVTTGVAVDGKGTVVVLVRTAPVLPGVYGGGKVREGVGRRRGCSVNRTACTSVRTADLGQRSEPQRRVQVQSRRQAPDDAGQVRRAGDNTSREAFTRPAGLTIAKNGDVFVADGYVNSRIVHFDKAGKLIKIVGGTKGKGRGELSLPHAVAIDSKGQILVGDSDNKRIVVFDREGTFVMSFPGPSRGGLVITPDDTLYASDVNAGAVTVFRNNQIVDVIRMGTRPHGLDVDPTTGDVYVASTTPDAPGVTKASPRRQP